MDINAKLFFHEQKYSINIFLICVLIAIYWACLPSSKYIFAIGIACAVPVLLIIKKKPEIGILAIVILISSIIFEEALPLIPIGVGSFHISDAILLFLLFLIPLNLLLDTRFPRRQNTSRHLTSLVLYGNTHSWVSRSLLL